MVVIIVLSVILAVTVRKYRRRKHHGGIKLDEQEPLCEEVGELATYHITLRLGSDFKLGALATIQL